MLTKTEIRPTLEDPWAGSNPIFVAGHPRSGNTWLLRLLSDFLQGPVRNLPPDLNADSRWCRDCAGDFVAVKTHWKFEQWDGQSTVVIIQRDPRDIATSQMFFRSLEPTDKNLAGTIHLFGEQNNGGYLNYIMPWLQSDVPAVRYEELHSEGPAALARLSYELVHHMPTRAECEGVFERVTFERCHFEDPHSARNGKVGDWQNYFRRSHGQQIDELVGEFMLEYQYTRGRDWWQSLPE